ncbi:T9SS type A sorting domain-containing protein [bacterium]|nr:T9SS type A sorting domain-containing protein [bacterium]
MRKLLVVLGLFIIVGVALGQPVTPHTVFGYFERFEGDPVPEACLHVQFDFNGHHFDETSTEFIYNESTGLFFLRINDGLFDVGDMITVSVGDSCLWEDQTYIDLFDPGPETIIETIVLSPISGLRPELLAGYMNPLTGYVTTDFEFGVTYASNPWNRAANIMQIWIDGTLFWNMDRVSSGPPSWATGEDYIYVVDGHDIGKGDHTYHFYAEDIWGLPVWTDPVDFIIMNTAPEPPEITLGPENPFVDEDLFITIDDPSFDEDGDEINYYYEWFKDGVLMDDLSGFMEDELDADNTRIGENWEVQVYGYDGYEFSFFVSDDVTIIAPTLTDGAVAPTTGDRSTVFNYSVTYTNIRDIAAFEVNLIIDGGEAVAMEMARSWDDGIEYTYETTLALGEHTFRFEGMDILGHACIGDILEHDGPMVGNNPPTIVSAYIVEDPSPATVVSTLTAVATGWDDADGDPEGYIYNWFVNDFEIGVATATLAAPYFVRGDMVYCTVTPWDGIDEGTSINTDPVEIANSIPGAPALDYTPVPVYDNDDIEIYVVEPTLDADDDDLDYHFEWTIDAAVVGDDSPILVGDFTAPGDLVHVDVWANDGFADSPISSLDIPIDWPLLSDGAVVPLTGTPVETFRYEVTYTSVRDIAPGMINAIIDGEELGMAQFDPADADYTDGVVFFYETTLPFGDHTYAFSGWDTEDNQAFGEETVRPGPVQENEVPVITIIEIAPYPTAIETDIIEVTVTTEDEDGDPVTLTYQWFNELGAIDGATSNILYSDDFAKGDVVWCNVLPFDGWEYGLEVVSDEVTIINTPPAITSARITSDPADWFNRLAVLVANVEAGDVDGDMLTFEYVWFVNDVEVAWTDSRLASDYFNRGDEVYFEVTVTDDSDEFATMVSEPVTILNAPPVFDLVDLTPDDPNTTNDLDLDVVVTDADDDELDITYSWYLNDLLIDWVEDFVPRHMTEKGQSWEVLVTAYDGMGGETEAADEVIIGNFIPEIHAIVETIVVWNIPYYNRIPAFDADVIDRLEWSIIEGPEGLEIDPFTGDIWWTEFDSMESLGVYPVIIEVTDGDDVSEIGFNFHLYPMSDELFAPRNLEALSGYMLSIPSSWDAPNLFGTSPILPITFNNYDVERSTDMDTWMSVGSPAGTGYVDASVMAGTMYYYRVRAIYEEDVSSWSNIDFATAGTVNSDMLYSTYTYNAPPVIDGEISSDEWTDATQLAIGGQKFYVKNTENMLYLAFIDGEDDMLDTDDAFYVQIEDNHNLRWPALEGSDEGEYRVTALDDGLSEATYQGIWGTYPGSIGRDLRGVSEAVFGAVGGGEGSAVIYELAIELGDEFDAQINSAMGNLIGFRFAIYDAGSYTWSYVWTTGSVNTNPETYGNLMLGIGEGGPAFDVWPRRFEVTVLQGESADRPIWISNQGNGAIDYEIFETYLPIWGREVSRDAMHPVLLYTDEQTIGMDALDFLGYGYHVVHTSADFVSQLDADNYLATVITVQEGLSPAVLGVLQTFIADGGKAVLSCPDLDGLSDHSIWPAIGVEVFADLGAIPSALTWDLPGHPIFNTPLEVPLSVETVTGDFADYGDGLLMTTGVSAASFDELPYPGNSAITLAGDEAMFINSFVISDEMDSDADGWTDGMELLTNEIYYVIGLEDIPWLSVAPNEGTLSSHETDDGMVTFDATELDEGDYNGWLVATSTDTRNPVIPVQCILHVREPDYNLATFSFPPDLRMVIPGEVINMPIRVRGLHLARVTEVTMTIRTNDFVISPMDVMSEDYDVMVTDYNMDHITFTISDDWMMDDGLLCNVQFQVKPLVPAGATSNLQIASAVINDGAFIDDIETVDGRVMVAAGENDWRVMLDFTHGDFEDNLYIGVNPLATDMFDDGLDMISDEIGAWFDPFSDIHEFDPANSQLDGDIRNSTDDLITWVIPVGDSAGKLEWSFRDTDTLAVMGSLFLNGIIDMKTTSVYFYDSGETIYISYRLAGDSPFDVHLYPGWNMVSLPITIPVMEPTVENIYPAVAYAYYYDPLTAMWVETDIIEPGVGYIVLSTTEQHYTLWGRPVDGFTANIINGWNLIGSVYSNADFSSPNTTPAGAVMAFPQHATHWDVMLGNYQYTDMLESGKGFFIAASMDAVLEVPGTAGSKAIVPEKDFSIGLRVISDKTETSLLIGEASDNWFVPIPPAVNGTHPSACLSIDGWNASEVYLTKSGSCYLTVNGPATIVVEGTNTELGIEVEGTIVPLDGTIELPCAGAYKVVFGNLPRVFALYGNVPNPFNPTTAIAFDLPEACDVHLEVFDMLGRHVRTLENNKLDAGRYSVVWDGRDAKGREASSGIYLYRIDAGNYKASRRMLLLK